MITLVVLKIDQLQWIESRALHYPPLVVFFFNILSTGINSKNVEDFN